MNGQDVLVSGHRYLVEWQEVGGECGATGEVPAVLRQPLDTRGWYMEMGG